MARFIGYHNTPKANAVLTASVDGSLCIADSQEAAESYRRGGRSAAHYCYEVEVEGKIMSEKQLRKLLEAIVHKFDGGPVGVESLAAAIGEERDTIEDVIEPYLIQHGFLQRTPRGRMATQTTWRHLGLTPPAGRGLEGELFQG